MRDLAPSLLMPSAFEASFASAADEPEKTIPLGQDPPGADNGQQLPPSGGKEVIPPPPIGNEDIHTDAPNPEAGHDEEVIPPPAPEEAPRVTPAVSVSRRDGGGKKETQGGDTVTAVYYPREDGTHVIGPKGSCTYQASPVIVVAVLRTEKDSRISA